jgi:hypothetical protein
MNKETILNKVSEANCKVDEALEMIDDLCQQFDNDVHNEDLIDAIEHIKYELEIMQGLMVTVWNEEDA